MTRRRTRALALLALCALAWPLAQLRGGRLADAYFDDAPSAVLPLADAVAGAMIEGTSPEQFSTGSDRFDGEWALVTCQMGLIGLAQTASRHDLAPERRRRYAAAAATCLDYLLSPVARAFGTAAWGEDGLEPAVLASDHGHAYLGWLNLGLAAGLRLLPSDDPAAHRAAETHSALSSALARRLDVLPVAAFETYPGETYPPDLAVVTASVASWGPDGLAAARRFAPRYREAAVDPETGLLFQSLSPSTGAPTDLPRGSGTAIAAAMWLHADETLARELATSARDQLWGAVAGCGGVREVPRGAPFRMDIDSGPVIFGLSVSASGFALADARLLGDRRWHRSLFRSAHAAGVPLSCGGERWFWTGGSLGNALMLAMLTGGSPWRE